jgi:hypothetical protein
MLINHPKISVNKYKNYKNKYVYNEAKVHKLNLPNKAHINKQSLLHKSKKQQNKYKN